MRSTLSSPLVALAVGVVCVAAEPERPNIIAIVTDDQALWTIGAYGNREVKTPHLDRLAAEGAKFTNAFVATPVCSPSRVEFFTGLYGTQVGITDYLNREEEAAGYGLPDSAVTWPAVLEKNGYTTQLIGKWHLGTLPQFHPTRHGFDRFFGWLLTPKWIDPMLEVDGRNTQLPGPLHDVLFDEALRFVEEKRNTPFALVVTTLAPHAPYVPVPDVDWEPYRDRDLTIPSFPGLDAEHVKGETRKYYASVRTIDRNLGRLLDGLDRLDLARRTIVLFTSDHGYMIGHHGLQHKGNAHAIAGGVRGPRRPNMFDDSIRVPLLIRGPGVARPGMVVEDVVSNVDTFASVLGMLGLAMPDGLNQNGANFSPALRGRAMPRRDALYGQYDLHNGGLAYMRMIRTDHWKLIRFYRSNDQDELYDLRTDPGELTNRYKDPAVAGEREALQARLTDWMRSLDDPLLSDPGYDASLDKPAAAETKP
jgi:uncharacterized sulfatase